MSFVDRARIWWWHQHPRYRRREQELRRNYQALVHEHTRSLEQRLQFHLDHLEEYWQRCLAFLEIGADHDPTFVAGDLALCIYLSSEAATSDVLTYCVTHDASALRAAWEQYSQSLNDMARAHPTVSVAVRRGRDEFRRVRAVHGRLRA